MSSKYKRYSDRKLIKITLGSKPDRELAYLELYNRYSKSVYNYCRYKFYDFNQAKEMFEQTFVEFYKAIIKKKQIDNVEAYLIGIVNNLLRSYLGKKKRNGQIIEYESSRSNYNSLDSVSSVDVENSEDSSSNLETQELISLIENAVELLDEDEKEIYKLNKFAGMSAGRIAKAFDLNLNTVKSKIFRAQSKVKKILKPYIQELKSQHQKTK